MKNLIITTTICLTCFLAIAQDTAKTITAADIQSDAYLNSLVKEKYKNPSGNDRANWSGMGSAFLNLFGTSNSTNLTFSPTLFTLTHFKKVANKDTNFVDREYREQWFARNLQINIGATPNPKNQIHLNDGSAGFKFAIINNKAASIKDYESLSNIIDLSDNINMILQRYKGFDNGKYKEAIEKFESSPSKNLIGTLPPELIAELKSKYKNINPETLLMPIADSLKSALAAKLANKPTLTFSTNDSYDFSKSQQNSINLSSEWTFNISKVSFDLNASYVWSVDSTKAESGLVRRVFTGTFGKNYTISKSFELKPAFDYVNTQGPLYKGETSQKVDASITSRIKVNDQFWIPIIFSYDVKHPQFFGFLSVQYSLK